MFWTDSKHFVILSGVGSSQCELSAQSKDLVSVCTRIGWTGNSHDAASLKRIPSIAGAASEHGVLRFRDALRFAQGVASFRMTEQ
ncbi:MAG: hypothetical protein DMG79_06580 [Acidobacteria bacterium]|nr:MAG: hypothetical protein DMG79_06580 [Acidobacteriota bacterium]